jgi:hypothetical protein
MGQYTAEELERAQAMAAEVNAMRQRGEKRTIQVQVDLFDLFRVIGCLQLAWRHPNLSDEQRVAIEGFTAQLELAFDADETPELCRTLEQGWHREYDR